MEIFSDKIFTQNILIPIIAITLSYINYSNSSYYQETQKPFSSVRFDKGTYGEYLSYNRMESLCGTGGKFLFNAYIPYGNGRTTEIDTILIHQGGIFVIESKNYGGWIFGNYRNKMWTQCLPTGDRGVSEKHQFVNPITQNESHIRALKRIIGEEYPFFSIIVFSDRCTFKNVTVGDSNSRVIRRRELYETISASCAYPRLSQETVEMLYAKLYSYTKVSDDEKARHVQNIISDKNRRLNSNQNSYCPKCGSKLVLRTASRGYSQGKQFYGCTNYPNCTYTRNI